ncbi:MAG TPA: IgGFc-binding protein [Polyangiaceae bacterium]|nr:IgGFc-binding protein [Polyangiaceae bacterium]
MPSDGGEGGLIITGLCGLDRCVCQPGQSSCSAGRAKACRADGSGYVEFDCDPVQGMTCEPGGCKGPCAETWTAASYIGCDYYPTVTLNPVWSGFDFAVAVGNASEAPAHVTVTRGSTAVATETVDRAGIQIIKLPWVTELKGGDVNACQSPPEPGNTRVVADGAYRLRTDVPVTVYQFSPLTYEIAPVPVDCPVGTQCPGGLDPACKSFSNDASLLFPANTLTGNYTGLSWPSGPKRAGFLAVTATEDDTDVEVTGHGTFAPGGGVDAAGRGIVKLARGDVLELIAEHAQPPQTYGSDLSGTLIRATHPVQVIGGHSCANIPAATTGYCDHLEQALFPVEVLGKDYLVTYPAAVASESPHVIRIAAVSPDTTITFDPPIAPSTTLGPDDAVFQIDNVTKDVRIQADKAILVAQYMQGSASVPSGSGDPSMSLAIPSAQFRPNYVFVAPLTYDSNFVNVIAPRGTVVSVDGMTLATSEFADIGASGFTVARHQLTGGDVHKVAAMGGSVGIVVYGYGKDTSYMYPGGLDLKRITLPPVK